MANVPEMVRIAAEVTPREVCLVPEKREELTTEGGLEVVGNRSALETTVSALRTSGIDVSLFLEADEDQIQAAADLGARCVELHTGSFCEADATSKAQELDRLIAAADFAHALGIKVNAGHGICVNHLSSVLTIPHLHTLNIGHSIVSRAVMIGLRKAILEMLSIIKSY